MTEHDFQECWERVKPYQERVDRLVSLTFWLFFIALAGLSNYIFNDYKLALFVACFFILFGAGAGMHLVMAMIERDCARGYGSTRRYWHRVCLALSFVVCAYVILKYVRN